jgi:Coenzyme PQQ synthesis protein D (PqqD)
MDAPLSFNSIVVASPEQVSCPLGDESAILNLKNSVYYGMNSVGTRVWALVKEPKRVGDVRDTIVNEYEVDSDRCGRDVLDLLEQMRGEGLIEVRETAAL